MNRVILSPEYFGNPTIGRPISNAQIFVGEADKMPQDFPIQASVQQENGNVVNVSQPIMTGAGGYPLYDGSTVTILVDGNYSLQVLDKLGSQIYYVPSQTDSSIPSDTFVTGESVSWDASYTNGGFARNPYLLSDLIAIVGVNGQQANTSGRLAIDDGGEGFFVWDETITPAVFNADPHMGIFVYAGGKVTDGCWVRRTVGLSASPFWWGIPLNSTDVDNTVAIQSVLDQPMYDFPSGFTSSCTTLYLKSFTHGTFRDARFTLMPNVSSGTQVIVMGDASGAICEDAVFSGGKFDGNKANQTATGNIGIAGGDGGLHGLQIHNAKNVNWYDSPRFVNCGTDGLIVWQRNVVGASWGITSIDDVHIHNPICSGNTRQGVSLIACDGVDLYDTICKLTNGTSPQAGIDLEGNQDYDHISARFHGTTRSYNNVGRGFMSNNPGGTYDIEIDKLILEQNEASDGQFFLYGASGSPKHNIVIGELIATNGAGSSSTDITFDDNTLTDTMNITFGRIVTDRRVTIRGSGTYNGGYMSAIGAQDSGTNGTLTIGAEARGCIENLDLTATDAGTNAFPLVINSTRGLVIGNAITDGNRALRLTDAENVIVRNLVASGTFLGDSVNLKSSSDCKVTAIIIGTRMDNTLLIEDLSNDNDIDITDNNVSSLSLANIIGDRNRIKIKASKSTAGNLVFLDAASENNLIHDSHLLGTGVTISDSGTGNSIQGTLPATLNAP
jgi:hypothetical protein